MSEVEGEGSATVFLPFLSVLEVQRFLSDRKLQVSQRLSRMNDMDVAAVYQIVMEKLKIQQSAQPLQQAEFHQLLQKYYPLLCDLDEETDVSTWQPCRKKESGGTGFMLKPTISSTVLTALSSRLLSAPGHQNVSLTLERINEHKTELHTRQQHDKERRRQDNTQKQ